MPFEAVELNEQSTNELIRVLRGYTAMISRELEAAEEMRAAGKPVSPIVLGKLIYNAAQLPGAIAREALYRHHPDQVMAVAAETTKDMSQLAEMFWSDSRDPYFSLAADTTRLTASVSGLMRTLKSMLPKKSRRG